jgi:hypothetical protein
MVNKSQKRNEYIRPSTFRNKEASIIVKETTKENIVINQGKEFRRTTPQRRSFTPRYQNFFLGHCFACTNFGHKVVNCRAYGRNVQERDAYVVPHNIECYNCHNLGHIAQNCRSMMEPSMKENNDIIYEKVWRRKENQEEHMNEEQVLEIVLTRLCSSARSG